MRTLNLNELENKINVDFNDIIYSEREYAQDKITQFLNFLHEQSISRRILERINEDFSILKSKLPPSSNNPGTIINIDYRIKEEVKLMLRKKEDQGAFGFFIIQELFEKETKYENHYLNAPQSWYNGITGDYNKRFDYFKELFFKPFVELLQWYIYESEVVSEKDYYSKNEILIINEKLDKILSTQIASSEVIFNEVDELKELLLFLNKKNWLEIFKGKLTDTIFAEILSNENIESLSNYISKNIHLLSKQ